MLYKHSKLLILMVLISPVISYASNCTEKLGCERKACEIENQMDIAKMNGNSQKFSGLSHALKQVTTYCTNEGLRNELLGKIDESNAEIIKYRADLNEAVTYQDKDRMIKYQKKIEEELDEVKEFEQELSLIP